MRSTIGLGLLVFLGLAGLAALNLAFGWFDGEDARRWIRELQGRPMLVALAVMALLSVDSVLSVPTMGTAALAGYLIGPLSGGAAASIGVLAAGTICYTIARAVPRSGDFSPARTLKPTSFLYARALPMLPETLSALAGASRMSYRRYLLWYSLGNLPLVFIAAVAGSVSGPDRVWPSVAAAVGLPVVAAIGWGAARFRVRAASTIVECPPE